MLTFFRSFFKSKIGLGLTLAFLALIAFAFASSDVANTGTFGGVGNAGRVATVADESITTSELSRASTSALDQVRQSDPTLSMPAFVAQGGIERVLDQMIDRLSLSTYAEKIGLRAGDNLINSEIQQIGAFRGANGEFDETIYRQVIGNQGLTDKRVREDIGQSLLAQQLLTPAQFGTAVPDKMARRYAALFKERRTGSIILVPTRSYIPDGDPTDAQLQAFYGQNRGVYIRPERRTVRYARFDSAAITDRIEPTDAAIAAYYKENEAQFAARDTRRFEQAILPSREAAEAVATAVRGGQSVDTAARAQGLRSSSLGPATRADVASSTSAAVADAYFSATANAVTAPARGTLGWYVARVTNVERTAGRSLASVRDEIAATVRENNRVRALGEISAGIEEQLDDGVALADVAQQYGLEIVTTPPLLATGQIYQARQGQLVDPIVVPALPTAFQMEEGEPQIAEIERGQQYLVFEVSRINESATAPLAEIRDSVAADWRIEQGFVAARAASDKLVGKLQGGTDVAAALREQKIAGSQVEQINLTREQLAQQGAQGVPPPLALMFSMAKGSTKRLAAPDLQGWFVVTLDEIQAGALADNDPLIGNARRSLGPLLGEEYAAQFIAAMRKKQGVERNEDAVTAVRQQLAGEN